MSTMLHEDVRGRVSDVLARDGISVGRTLELIKSRANGATPDQLLTAFVALLREQADRIAELEAEVDELDDDLGRAEEEVEELEEELETLRTKLRGAK